MKKIEEIVKLLNIKIKELKILRELIIIYNAFVKAEKLDEFDIQLLIKNLLDDKLKTKIEYIEKILSNIFNIKNSKVEFSLDKLLQIILENFISSDIYEYQNSIDNLSNPTLRIFENKIDNEIFKKSLISAYIEISRIYIENINENKSSKKEIKNNILYEIKSYFEYCLDFLERIYKNNDDNDEDFNFENVHLKILFSLTLIVIYLKTFIYFINKDEIDSNQIEEIIKIINGTEQNPFRDMIKKLNYTILFHYKINQLDIIGIFKNDVIEKYHLKSYLNFNIDKKRENDINEFDKEYDEYKNLNIYIKNAYDIYCLLEVDSKYNNEKRNKLEAQYLKEERRMRKYSKISESDDEDEEKSLKEGTRKFDDISESDDDEDSRD